LFICLINDVEKQTGGLKWCHVDCLPLPTLECLRFNSVINFNSIWFILCSVLKCLSEIVLILLWWCCINYVWTYEVLLWYNLLFSEQYILTFNHFFLMFFILTGQMMNLSNHWELEHWFEFCEYFIWIGRSDALCKN